MIVIANIPMNYGVSHIQASVTSRNICMKVYA